MQIRLSKGKHGKNGALTCLRADGSCTWQASTDYFARHDLIHYAVETTLGYREAFLGLVAQGRDLDSFGTKNGVKDTYTQEEGWAEAIAGMIQWPSFLGGPPLSDAELIALLHKTCSDHDMPAPPITPEQVATIRNRAQELHRAWEALPEGEGLELCF